jgi:sterol desaturase/sphingolipid hydroxylase (fatty acid hydroxylase superfamily)
MSPFELVSRHFHNALEMLLLGLGFFVLALVVKGKRAITDGRAATAETKSNIVLYVVDQLTVAPTFVLVASAFSLWIHPPGSEVPGAAFWTAVGPVGSVALALFLCDFIGYVNHRIYHTAALWPTHALHHSDTHLTWFSLIRQHPIDRIGSLIDLLGLILLGVPEWAILIALPIRHYYGHLIHADLPWTYGPLSWIFTSPAAHRWHHAREHSGAGVNFATVFALIDRTFGTYHVPGPCTVPTGIDEEIAPGLTGQYLHPFRVWAERLKPATPATQG